MRQWILPTISPGDSAHCNPNPTVERSLKINVDNKVAQRHTRAREHSRHSFSRYWNFERSIRQKSTPFMIAHCAAPQDDTCVIHKGRITRLCTRRKSINFAPHATQCSKITDVPFSINLQIILFLPQKRRKGSSSTIFNLCSNF